MHECLPIFRLSFTSSFLTPAQSTFISFYRMCLCWCCTNRAKSQDVQKWSNDELPYTFSYFYDSSLDEQHCCPYNHQDPATCTLLNHQFLILLYPNTSYLFPPLLTYCHLILEPITGSFLIFLYLLASLIHTSTSKIKSDHVTLLF